MRIRGGRRGKEGEGEVNRCDSSRRDVKLWRVWSEMFLWDNDGWQGSRTPLPSPAQPRRVHCCDDTMKESRSYWWGPHCLGEECQLYWEEMIHQLAYFHNNIIDSKYRKYPNPVINILKECQERLLKDCRPNLAEIKVSVAATLVTLCSLQCRALIDWTI